MQHRISIADIVHHMGVAASSQRNYAESIGNDQLSRQFTRQAEQADEIANIFIELDNNESAGVIGIRIDGDEIVVTV